MTGRKIQADDLVRLELTPECPEHDPNRNPRLSALDGYCGVVVEVREGEGHGLTVAVCKNRRDGPDEGCFCCFLRKNQLKLDEREVSPEG